MSKRERFLSEESGTEIYKDKGKDTARVLKLALALSLTSLVLTFIGLLLTVITLETSHTQPQPIEREEEEKPFACIACRKLLTDPTINITHDPLLSTLTRSMEDDTEMCCAYNTEQMSTMFQSVMRRNEPQEAPLPSYNVSDFMFSPVSAHKRIYPKTQPMGFGVIEFPSRPEVCYFNQTDLPGLEHHREVDISDEGIRIRHGGLYYIYSSVEFRPQSLYRCSKFKTQTFTHSVVRFAKQRSSQSQKILGTTYTCCDNCVSTPETRFTGGLFVLDPGDIIQVTVTGYKLVHFIPETSYAGLAMLGSVNK